MTKYKFASMLSLIDENYISEAEPTQNKPERKFSWKKIAAIAASICVVSALAVSILIPTLNHNAPPISTGLEWGFQVADGDEVPTNSCAYKIAKAEFDIGENINVTFYFGGAFADDINHEREVNNIPEFDVYFGDTEQNLLYLIRHSTENFVSEEYRVTLVYDENWHIKEKVYNHSESVTIPQELLTEQQGVICFYVSGMNINELEPEYEPIVGVLINYDIENGKVVLSKWDGHRK